MWHLDHARHTVSSRTGSFAFLLVFAPLVATPHLTGTGRAQVTTAPSTAPVLRIEAGQHDTIIWRIDTDAAERFVVGASDDKTVRVWSSPDGRLVGILRLPIDADDANIGNAYAVAMSPDGNTVAIGGYLAKDWQHNYIFLFDRTSGELTQRVGDLPNVVNHLAYSSDGRRLATSLAGINGIWMFDAGKAYGLIPSNAQYKDLSLSAMFDRAGRLVTTSYDGFVRLYAADNYAIPVARFDSNGHRRYSAAFSPDGSRIAVGYRNVNEVLVLSSSDLTELFDANTIDLPKCRSVWRPTGCWLVVGWAL
jgi:WD40 repeat protein